MRASARVSPDEDGVHHCCRQLPCTVTDTAGPPTKQHAALFKGAQYLLIIHEVLVAMDFFSAGVQDETLEEESQRLAS